MLELRTAHLFTVTFTVNPILNLGKTPMGDRRVAIITGGNFEGKRLKGTVAEGGSDWILARPDALSLDVRVALKTHDGHLIGMTYRGYRHGPPEILERLNRGEAVEPSSYYFRVAPFFETGAEPYSWLNRIVAVGTGHRLPEGPVYDIYEVL